MTRNNKIKYGICNVYYAKATVGEGGIVTYAEPKPFPGAKSMTLSATGTINQFFCDNTVYYQSSGGQGYDGDLEMALIHDDFCIDILGDEKDANENILEKDNAESSFFALLFQFEGDVKAIRHCLYYCSAARTDISGSTKENDITPGTEKVKLTARPRPDNGNVKYRTTVNTSAEIYEKWFTAVPEPAAA